ncbi:chromosome partitioning protein [Nakamurella silvestris]|nr:chromosome partitioning protein [Nakamurella silvestris]
MNGVLTVGSGRPWESALVAALDRSGSTFTVVRRCADIADLLTSATTGRAVVAVVDGNVRRFDSEAVDRLHSVGVAIVGICGTSDPRTVHRLGQIGVHTVVDGGTGVAEIIAAAARAVDHLADLGPDTAVAGDPRRALPAGARRRDGSVSGAEPTGGGGRVIAVWGPAGAPGRTTVAAGLADAAAVHGVSTVLVDADVYGGVLASAFGLLDESPGLAGACRLAAHGRLEPAELDRLCWSVAPGLRLLTGIARADRWPEVRPSAVPGVLAVARRLCALTVADCGFSLESDEELSYDTVAPRRNGATLSLLTHADLVLVVGSADPPGMERLIRGLGELAEAAPQIRPTVLLNRVRSSAASYPEAAEALLRFTGLEALAGLPEDRRSTDAAWVRGSTLSRTAGGSALYAAFSRVTRILVPAAAVGRSAAVPR